jgi:CheY-like chemotaxis protein
MTSTGRILIVDDDREFVAYYRDVLENLGIAVEIAYEQEEAGRKLEELGGGLDVVLLDQKLQGPGGRDTGLELIARARHHARFAKVLVVTGYATPEAIERAFQLGVYDYLVKNGAFEALLRAKVRNAVEVTREARLATLSREQVVAELHAAWGRVQTEPDRNLKGRALEDLVKLLFRATPGFERVQTRLRNELEEIDIDIANRSADPTWAGEGPYFVGECKNWSTPCGVPELRDFRGKLETKFGRVRIGFFIAPGGFAKTFAAEAARHSKDDVLVIPVDGEALQRWIEAEDRLAVLNELHQRAVFAVPT